MNQLLVSIITIVLNDKAGFEKTAKSVIRQTALSNAEWIVIDGNSNDGTKDIIKKYIKYTSHVISETDKGIYDAMNKGVSLAKGEYMLFMNAGDILHDNFVLENIFKESFFGKVDYISGNTFFTSKGKIFFKKNSPKEITASFFYIDSLCHQSTLIKSNRIKLKGYDTNYKIVADAKFFFEELIIKNSSYHKTDIYISEYDTGGISSRQYELTNFERRRFLEELLPPRINADIERLAYGRTMLEQILAKIKNNGIIYKCISIIAIMLYSPISLKGRIKRYIKMKKKQ